MKKLFIGALLLCALTLFGAQTTYVGKFIGDGSSLTNVNGGGGGSATNALVNGPGGVYDASLVTNVPAANVVGSLTNNTSGNAATATAALSLGANIVTNAGTVNITTANASITAGGSGSISTSGGGSIHTTAGNIFTTVGNIIVGWGSQFYGDAGQLTNLNAAQLAGAVPLAALPSTMVTNPSAIYVQSFGAVGDGTTDDTAALQAAINSVTNGTILLDAKTYRLTSQLVVNHPVTIRGKGVFPIYPSGTNNATESEAFPTVPPYLSGSVLLQSGAGQNIFLVTNYIGPFNAMDFGMMWTTNLMFADSGYGIYCQPAFLGVNGNAQYGNNGCFETGIQHSEWRNLFVLGTRTNCFSYYIADGLLNDFEHIQSVGGGGFEYASLNNGFCGNFVINNSDFLVAAFGSTLGIWIHAASNNWCASNFSINRSQVGCYNSPYFAAFTGADAVSLTNTILFDPLGVQGAHIMGCTFENSVSPGAMEFHLDSNPGITLEQVSGFSGQTVQVNGGFFVQTNVAHGMPDTIKSIPSVSTAGFSLGKYPKAHAGFWVLDWADTQFGGPYFAGMDYDVANNWTRFFRSANPAYAPTLGWRFGNMDLGQSTFTNEFHIDPAGNFDFTGVASGSGAGMTNIPSTGVTGFTSFGQFLILTNLFIYPSNFYNGTAWSNCPFLTVSVPAGTYGAQLHVEKYWADCAGSITAGLSFSPNVTNEYSSKRYTASQADGYQHWAVGNITFPNGNTGVDIDGQAVGAGGQYGSIDTDFTFTCTNTTTVAAAFATQINTNGVIRAAWLRIFKP